MASLQETRGVAKETVGISGFAPTYPYTHHPLCEISLHFVSSVMQAKRSRKGRERAGDTPSEFESRVDVSSKVKINKECRRLARCSKERVLNCAGLSLEHGLFYIMNKMAGIVEAHGRGPWLHLRRDVIGATKNSC